MRKSRPNRVRLLGVAVILASGRFLAACAVDPIEPTAAASAADPIEITSGSATASVEPEAASAAGSVDPAPVSTNHTMATDIVGPVDLGPEPATVKTTEVAGPIEDARGAVHAAMSRRHGIASDQHHRLVTASTSHHKSPRQVAARQAPARKQAKVSAETRAAGPKT
jgi:hypothetical protein